MNDAIAPRTRQLLKENGFSEAEFLAVRDRLRFPKASAYLDEWNRIQRENFAYEKKRKRERLATGR